MDRKKCFVITPIGDNNTEIRRHIDGIIDQAIIPALKEKYDIIVAHRDYSIGSINEKVIQSVYESDLIVANLTGLNPNVMFELAIRYSFGKPAIVIAEEGTKLPFDVVDERTIFYVNDPAGAYELKKSIFDYEKNIKFDVNIYGPVYKAINVLPVYKSIESGESFSSDTALKYIISRLDTIENRINHTRSMGKAPRKTLRISFDENQFSQQDIMSKIEEATIISNECVTGYERIEGGIKIYLEASDSAINEVEKRVTDLLQENGLDGLVTYVY